MKIQAYIDSCDFLNKLIDEGHINDRTASLASNLLNHIYTQLPTLGMPRIGAGPDGMVGFTWENQELHVNIEVSQFTYIYWVVDDLVNAKTDHGELYQTLPSIKLICFLRKLL